LIFDIAITDSCYTKLFKLFEEMFMSVFLKLEEFWVVPFLIIYDYMTSFHSFEIFLFLADPLGRISSNVSTADMNKN